MQSKNHLHKSSSEKVIIEYDGTCNFCISWVKRIQKMDKKHIFLYDPITEIRESLVVVEGEKSWVAAKAALRIFWLLGGLYKVVGIFHYLPSVCIDPIYFFFAKRRNQ